MKSTDRIQCPFKGKILKDFTFSDGGHVPAGNMTCVPQQVVMRDAKYYERPHEVLPFRFMSNHDDENVADQKLTKLKPHFYLGAAKKPW